LFNIVIHFPPLSSAGEGRYKYGEIRRNKLTKSKNILEIAQKWFIV